MFYPHRGSQSQHKHTCSRTEVTVSYRTLLQMEDAQLVRQKTARKEMRISWTEEAECCPEQLHSVPKYGTESLWSILRLCTQSRAPCPGLWPTSAASPSSLSCAGHVLFSFVPTHPSILPLPFLHAQAPCVLFLSLALATDFPLPSSDLTPVFLTQIVSSFALKPTYIQISIWSYFELISYFFLSKPLITITVSMRYTLILTENACFP